MNQGVELILKRMESHPEEFEVKFVYDTSGYRQQGKWQWLIDRVAHRAEEVERGPLEHLPFISDEEIKLIYDKLMMIQATVFIRTVMHTIMSKPEEAEYDTFSNTTTAIASTSPVITLPQIHQDAYKILNHSYQMMTFDEEQELMKLAKP